MKADVYGDDRIFRLFYVIAVLKTIATHERCIRPRPLNAQYSIFS